MSASSRGYRRGVPVVRADARQVEKAAGDYVFTHHRIDAGEVEASLWALGFEAEDLDADTLRRHILRETRGKGYDGLTVERYRVPVEHVIQEEPDIHERYCITYVPPRMEDVPGNGCPYAEEHLEEASTPSRMGWAGEKGVAHARAVVASFL